MPRRPGHILPFRIPFFRIFYSTTYTIVYLLCLCVLAITPVSMLWQAVQQRAYQYIIMIGATYVLTAIIAIFIYASRLYTNRSSMAGVGKAYVPVEQGEVGKAVRKMIVKQLERSALIAWESRPRDLYAEALHAEHRATIHMNGVLASSGMHAVGREVTVDPAVPPWGDVQHAGWSSPAHRNDNSMPDVQFANVITELPNLIEARAVSLAPPDPRMTPTEDAPMPDPVMVEALQRPQNTGIRDYLTQLSYLGLVNPPDVGHAFLQQYERARFGGFPITEPAFNTLMAAFAELLSGMEGLDRAIIDEIRLQAAEIESVKDFAPQIPEIQTDGIPAASPPRTPESSLMSPVTARTAPSRNITPYLQQNTASVESVGSVIHQPSEDIEDPEVNRGSLDTSSLASISSDAGSVVRHRSSPPVG